MCDFGGAWKTAISVWLRRTSTDINRLGHDGATFVPQTRNLNPKPKP